MLNKFKKQNLFKGFAFFIVLIALAVSYYQTNVKLKVATVEIYYTGQNYGKILSCGCTLQDLGGIHRRANYLANRSKSSVLLDYGNFFATDPNSKDHKLYSELSSKLGYSALNFASKDSALKASDNFPFVSIHSNDPKVPKSLLLNAGDTVLWITGIHKSSPEILVELKKELANRPPHSIPILLSNLNTADGISFLKKLNSTVIMIGESYMSPDLMHRHIGNSFFISGSDRGRYISYLNVEAVFNGRNLVQINPKEIRMDAMNKKLDIGAAGDEFLALIKAWEKENGPLPNDEAH